MIRIALVVAFALLAGCTDDNPDLEPKLTVLGPPSMPSSAVGSTGENPSEEDASPAAGEDAVSAPDINPQGDSEDTLDSEDGEDSVDPDGPTGKTPSQTRDRPPTAPDPRRSSRR